MTMKTLRNRTIVLRSYPADRIAPEDFELVERDVPAPGPGSFLVRNLFISVDPMMRLSLDARPMGGSRGPFPLGKTISSAAVGEVVESQHPDFRVGDIVEGGFGWQDYALSSGKGVIRVNPDLGPPENALGVGGHPGFTAYVGLHIADLRPGQTVLVSGAAGAVGSVVGALVKARGARAVGIAGGAQKRRFLLEDVGYDAVADRLSDAFDRDLAAALTNGVDVYFDNVGGALFPQIMPLMARGGLALICGLMAQYQSPPDAAAGDLPAVLNAILYKQIRVQGFTWVGRSDLRAPFELEIAQLLAQGRIRSKFHIVEGIDRLPHALVGLFEHSTMGKVLVRP